MWCHYWPANIVLSKGKTTLVTLMSYMQYINKIYPFSNQYTETTAPDLWMRDTQVKPNSSKCLLNAENLNSFFLLGPQGHQKYFFHLELLAGATSEEQFLYNLEENKVHLN